ncbi:hypothetical protein ACH5RR_025134 [Cinchona calisaya]|uniref:Miraculin n=1 Tax=Cinchona calisaya TaxID=153742 RepID=A0ABD2Z2T9_9GENT
MMKMKTTQSIPLSFLLLSTNLLLGIANSVSHDVAVLDTNGKEVRPGDNYYIVPAERGKGGGVTLSNYCPYHVIQTLNEPTNGLPLKFSPVNRHERVVQLNTDINIKFIDFHGSKCKESKVWKFDANKQIPDGNYFVTTGGVEGQTGSQSLPNWFKIQKFEDAYKLEYCPSANLCNGPCVDQTIVCRDIGSVLHNGQRRLAVQPPALKVKFKKA